MKKSINEKYYQTVSYRNDIYRKFEKQFKYCFLNPINIDDSLYVEHSTDEYKKSFDLFFGSNNSDIKFFIGYTGVGKTTYTKHYLNYKTLGIDSFDSESLVIPNSWDGLRISDGNFSKEIDNQISNVLDTILGEIYKPFEEFVIEESDKIIKYLKSIRIGINDSLTIEEIYLTQKIGCTINQLKIQKIKEKHPVEFSSVLLKYIIDNHNQKGIKKLFFVVDDLETLSQIKLRYIIESYFKIYACMHNTKSSPIIKLLINLRPHSFRFLRQDIKPQYVNSYGNYFNSESYRIIKNRIPDIRRIFKKRFEGAILQTPEPGNRTTWDAAKKVFYEIIDDFDDNLIEMIEDLCHKNIRAITDCFQLVLSNRVWCQEFKDYSDYPNVNKLDYHFDIVNVVRTLACGESPVYTGKKEIQFNPKNLSNIQSRPVFDDSNVFIPNLIVNVHSKECDILALVIINYLDGYFSSKNQTLPQTEFISRNTLTKNLFEAFGQTVEKEKLDYTIDYLFENRVIRKSIVSKDSDEKINKLEDDDFLYLTLKGSRLFSMLESDSVLLEIFREDVKRIYSNEKKYKTSFELIAENKPELLFDDLIDLVVEIYHSEDYYQKQIQESSEVSSFYNITFPITNKVLCGIKQSLSRSQSIIFNHKKILYKKIDELELRVEKRISEMKISSN